MLINITDQAAIYEILSLKLVREIRRGQGSHRKGKYLQIEGTTVSIGFSQSNVIWMAYRRSLAINIYRINLKKGNTTDC